MIPPIWQRGQGGDELESLQTDVMRFFAILGLCLAAIFSLVNSAVTGAPANAPLQPAPVTAAPEPSRAAPVHDAVPEPQRQRDMAPAPEPAAERLAEVEPVPRVPAQPGSKAPRKSDAMNPAVTPDPTATESDELVSAEPERPAADPAAKPRPPSSPGFTLAFESTEALERLMDADRVTLFALGDRRYWAMAGGRLQVVEPPSHYYRMDTATVPLAWQRLAATISAATDIVWGVSLPPDTSAAITRHTRDAAGGELLILASGEVVLSQRYGKD